ncbi:MAG: MASE1 domain-containing protein, partial [Bradyrhizobium sp.]
MERATFDKVENSAFDSAGSAATYLVELLIIAALYFGLAELARELPATNPSATPLWPPTGLALSLILVRGYRIWPAILVGSAAPYLAADRSLLVFGSAGIGTLLAALAGAWLIHRWSNGRETFATPSSVARFAILSFVPTTLMSATVASAGFILASKPGFSDSIARWLTWWLADAAGTLVIAPVVVLCATMPLRRWPKWSLLEAVAVAALVSIIGIVSYSPLIGPHLINHGVNVPLAHRSLLGFLVTLPLMWAGLRGNRGHVAAAALLFVGMAVWGFSAGNDPFPKTDLNGALLSLFVLSISVSVLPLALAAAIATRQNTEAYLLSVQDQLNRQMERKALALDSVRRHFHVLIEGVVDYAIFALDKEGHVTSWNSTAHKIIGYTPDEIIGKHFGILY